MVFAEGLVAFAVGNDIALPQAVDVTGRRVPVAGLRARREASGLRKVETRIQGGHLVYGGLGAARQREARYIRDPKDVQR